MGHHQESHSLAGCARSVFRRMESVRKLARRIGSEIGDQAAYRGGTLGRCVFLHGRQGAGLYKRCLCAVSRVSYRAGLIRIGGVKCIFAKVSGSVKAVMV